MTVTEGLQAFEADSKWIDSHHEELKNNYPNEWIAVQNKVVVEHGTDMSLVVDTIKERFPENHTHIPIEYISTENIQLILGTQR